MKVAAHLGLARRAHLPRRRPARRPGGGAAPPRRAGRGRARSTSCWSPGDIYDRAVPSAEAVQVRDRVLARIRAGRRADRAHARATTTPRRGWAPSPSFAAAGGLHLRTSDRRDSHEPVLLDDEHGPVAVYGSLTWSRNRRGTRWASPDARATPACSPRRCAGPRRPRRPGRGHASVVLAHAFVTGGAPTESERTDRRRRGRARRPARCSTASTTSRSATCTARRRSAEHLRYSGSPLAYSFSEAGHRKCVWLVDLDAAGLAECSGTSCRCRARWPPSRRARRAARDPAHADVEDHYLSVTLTDRVRPVDAMRRLRERFPHAVHLDWQPEGGAPPAPLRYADAVRGRSRRRDRRSFVADCRGAAPSRERGAARCSTRRPSEAVAARGGAVAR